MGQVAYIGPMWSTSPVSCTIRVKVNLGSRYFKYRRIYKELDEDYQNLIIQQEKIILSLILQHFSSCRHKWHDIGLKNFANLTRWYLEISERCR